MSYYAVAKGKIPGIFRTWPECESQVKGFRGAVFKKFKTETEAQEFIQQKTGSGSAATKTSTIVPKTVPAKKVTPDKPVYTSSNSEFSMGNDDLDDSAFLNIPDTSSSVTAPKKKPKPKKAIQVPALSRKRKMPSAAAIEANKKLFDIKYKKPNPTISKVYGGYEFQEDEDHFVHVYTDGSCENNGLKNAAAGLGVYFGDNHPLNRSEPVKGRATNNCGEIQASILAIREAHKCGIKQLAIMTDSQFLIKSICVWLPNWKRNNWKLPSGEPVKNKVDFEELDNLMTETDMTIKWHYVRAHKGIHGNEIADRLAKEGAVIYKVEKLASKKKKK